MAKSKVSSKKRVARKTATKRPRLFLAEPTCFDCNPEHETQVRERLARMAEAEDDFIAALRREMAS